MIRRLSMVDYSLIGKKISEIETANNYVELDDIVGLLKEKENEI